MAESLNDGPVPKNREDVRSALMSLICDSLGVQLDTIHDSSDFVDDLGADSLDIVELVMLIESRFSIEIPDEEAEKITTVGDAIEHITAALRL